MLSYGIIALDLDGTLLNDASEIPEENVRALREAAAAGVAIVCASGRKTEAVRRIPNTLGMDGPLISYNGAMARDSKAQGETILFHYPLPRQYADALIDYTREQHFQLNFYLDESLYAWDDPERRRLADLYHARTGSTYQFIADLAELKGSTPTKALLLTDPTDPACPNPRHRDEQYAFWQARWGGEIMLMRTEPEYLEFLNPKASKGAALAKIAEHLGVPQAQVMAIGDGRNDMSMIEWAGMGVAVANAHAEVKAAADYVCERTNNDAGVAEAIRRFVRG